jgi:SAM-dependent methyltransferase
MKIFDKYADYYDLLYEDKNYKEESAYIEQIIKKHSQNAKTILDLGCGTGTHDFILTEKGYHLTGLDNSETNIQKARLKTSSLGLNSPTIKFIKSDIRNARLNETFDVVISLFHVMSYQTTNSDLISALTTAKEHLKPGGLFIFDCWYGPAVLADPPTVRIKNVENENISVTRIADPEMRPNDNIVNVNYRILIKDKATCRVEEIHETHSMRYLFNPEVEEMLHRTGFKLYTCTEWMTNKAPGFDTWNTVFISKI